MYRRLKWTGDTLKAALEAMGQALYQASGHFENAVKALQTAVSDSHAMTGDLRDVVDALSDVMDTGEGSAASSAAPSGPWATQ